MRAAGDGQGRHGRHRRDKIGANASKDANRTEEGLRRLAAELAAAHAQADAAEDALPGKGKRDDDDPGDPSTRAQRIDAALASLAAERAAREAEEQAAAQAHLQAVRAGTPPPGRRPAGAEVAAAEAKVARVKAAYQEKLRERRRPSRPGRGRRPGSRRFPPMTSTGSAGPGRTWSGPGPWRAPAWRNTRNGRKTGRAVRNVTDPASRLMPLRGGGFVQGYNPQNVSSEDGLVIATRLTSSPAHSRFYEPLISQAQAAAAEMAAAGGPGTGDIGLALADAGYLSLHNLTCPGPDRLIATGNRRNLEKNARQGGEAGQPDGKTPRSPR